MSSKETARTELDRAINGADILEWLRSYRFETGADSLVAARFDALATFLETFPSNAKQP